MINFRLTIYNNTKDRNLLRTLKQREQELTITLTIKAVFTVAPLGEIMQEILAMIETNKRRQRFRLTNFFRTDYST